MSAQADNVVPLPTSDPPSDRELAQQLIELIDARAKLESEHREAQAIVDQRAQAMREAEEMIDDLKRQLGASVKKRRRPRPTGAASSKDGSPRTAAQLRPLVEKAMADHESRKPIEVIEAMGVTDRHEKMAVRSLLQRMVKSGAMSRRRSGRTNAGAPAYAYRLKR